MTQVVMLALDVCNLRKTYNNDLIALHAVNLEVTAGDFFALLGPNGAGKSTIIGIVCSLINKTSGSVKVFGYDLDQQPAQVKACIGLVPQEFNCNQFQPLAEILINQAGFYGIPRRQALIRAEYFLQRLELWERRHRPARELSGGMKRRLMIARALVHHPKLLILDEPTAGVDVEIRHSMWEFLTELNALGTTIILTTHYLEEVEKLCRNLAIIDQGCIIEYASLKDVLERLRTEIILLDLQQPLLTAPDCPGFTIRLLNAHTLEVMTNKTSGLNELFAALSDQGITVVSMRNKQNRLEQLLIDQLATRRPK